MGDKYYVVFIKWDSDAFYGIHTATYMAQICKSEEAAKAYIDSPKCKKQIEEVSKDEPWYCDGKSRAFYKEFSNSDKPLLVGGFYYFE